MDIDECPLLDDFLSNSRAACIEIQERPDLLDVLSSRQNLEEAMQPQRVSTMLKRCAIIISTSLHLATHSLSSLEDTLTHSVLSDIKSRL